MSGGGGGGGGRSSWLRCCSVMFALLLSALLCCCVFFKFKKGWELEDASAACTPCTCHCSHPQSLLEIVPGLANLTVTDCGKDDPDLKEEMEKQNVDLLSEEMRLQEAVGKEQSLHMNITLGEARKLASQYQKEAEKCNAATETCEGSRELAEALLIKERKNTLLWQRRAKLLGWE